VGLGLGVGTGVAVGTGVGLGDGLGLGLASNDAPATAPLLGAGVPPGIASATPTPSAIAPTTAIVATGNSGRLIVPSSG
jgi:hypothetical protein